MKMSEPPASLALPRMPKRRSAPLGRGLARALCALLALLGLLPLALAGAVRSPWAQRQAEAYAQGLLAAQGIEASFTAGVGLWPPRVELTRLTVLSSDGGAPFLTAARAAVRPRIFALLAGKPKIAEIDVDAPRVRVVMQGGKLMNLRLPETKGSASSEPFHAPFDGVGLTDLHIDFASEALTASADGIDLDISADDDARAGSTLEVALRSSSIQLHRRRPTGDAGARIAFDDDDICGVDARVRVEPGAVLVRRLKLSGAVDLDSGSGATVGCDLLTGDKRNLELALSHFRIELPKTPDARPALEGHAHVRAPVGLAQRVAQLPETDGWIAADADVRFLPEMQLPELDGRVEAHDIALRDFHLAESIEADVSIHDGVVKSKRLAIALSGGKVALTGIEVSPLAPAIPLRCSLEAGGVNFTRLMVDLGVSQHPLVAWDLNEVHAPLLSGTIFPLKIDGAFEAQTTGFTVYDRGFDRPDRQRVLSVSAAKVGAQLAVRDTGVQFRSAFVDGPHGHAEGGYVALYYAGGVQVDVPTASIGLEDISPIATTPMAGRVGLSAFHFLAANNKPVHITATAQIKDYVLGEMALGDITNVNAELTNLTLDLREVRATKGSSTYAMPAGRVDFGSDGPGLTVDGAIGTTDLKLRDALAIFNLDDDPRFEGIEAKARADAAFHFASGGPSDVCGTGALSVHATTHLTDLLLFGEEFADGDADFDFRWRDRRAGLAGGEIDAHAITLHKHRNNDVTAVGSVLGSFKSDIGGAVHGNFVIEGVPLSRLQTLGALGSEAEAAVSGIAQLGGTLSALTTDADVDISPLSFRGAKFGASKLHASMLNASPPGAVIGHTRCGGAIVQEVGKAALRDSPSRLTAEVSGDLLGGQIQLRSLSLSRRKLAEVSAAMTIRNLDLGQVARATGAFDGAPPSGALSGELVISKATQGAFDSAEVRFAPSSLFLERGGNRVTLRPTGVWLVVAKDTLFVSPITLDLATPTGLTGSVSVRGEASHVTTDPRLAFDADLMPVDLGVLVGVVPRLTSAKGQLSGHLSASGPARAPSVKGDVHVRGAELTAKDVPGAVTELDIDMIADTQELRVDRGSARYAGGSVTFTGRAPIKGLAFAGAELDVSARGLRLQPQDGISVGVDADLALTSAGGGDIEGQSLPRLAGDVTLTSFEYTRPISIASDLSSIGGGKAKRTVVESYDPALDALSFDVRVRSRAPLRIKNNLAEAQFLSETDFLAVSGTNQRMGLRGGLKSLPGGRFRLPFGASVFEVKQAFLRFDDPTRIAAVVDVFAETEYRRGDSSSSSLSSTARGGSLWRIGLHAYGETDNLKIDMSSDPPLSQEDIVLLLTVGMTRAEIDQLQAGALGAGAALEALSAVSGASTAVRAAIPVIDDFRFGSAYSPRTGRTEPQVTIGKRITNQIRANVSTGLSEDRDLRANVQWRLSNRLSVQGSYDNVSDVSSSSVGNLGIDLRWRLEFE